MKDTISAHFCAYFRFYEELNDFLPVEKRKKEFGYCFTGTPSIKDAVEAIGVPHPEIDLILVNGVSVGFDYHLKRDDRVSVYPVFEFFDITPMVKLREKPLRESRFICDVHAGKLSRYLRLLGFDAFYRNDYDDATIVSIAHDEKRIILTRDLRLLFIKTVTHGYRLRSQDSLEQLKEVMKKFHLHSQIKPFTRCMACNGIVTRVEKNAVLTKIEPKTARYYSVFYRCSGCGNVYWEGSHCARLRDIVNQILHTPDSLP